MKLTAAGIELVKRFEGCRLDAYLDTGGVATIGWGTTLGVHMGQTITQAQADAMLANDLTFFATGVAKLVRTDLGDNQFSALVSFAYNVGLQAFAGSTLLKRVNAGRFADVPAELERWVNDGGHRLTGLVRRRRAEADLWCTP